MNEFFRLYQEIWKEGNKPIFMEINSQWYHNINQYGISPHYIKIIDEGLAIFLNTLIIENQDINGWKIYSTNGYSEGEYKNEKYIITKNKCYNNRHHVDIVGEYRDKKIDYDILVKYVYYGLEYYNFIDDKVIEKVSHDIKIYKEYDINIKNIVRQYELDKKYKYIIGRI